MKIIVHRKQQYKISRFCSILNFSSYEIPIQIALSHLRLYSHLTVEEHLKLFISILGVNYSEHEENLLNNLHSFEIEKTKLGAQLSDSECKLVMYVLILSLQPKIILLDEPGHILSESQYQRLRRILIQHKKNDSVLLIATTCREEARYFGDRIGKLQEGQKVEWSQPMFSSMSSRLIFSPSIDETIRKDSKMEFVSHKTSIDSIFRSTFQNSERMKEEMSTFQSPFVKCQAESGIFMLQLKNSVQFFTLLKTIVKNTLRNCRSKLLGARLK